MPIYRTTDFPLGPVRLERPPGKPRFGIVVQLFAFISPTLGRVEVPVGFDTDYASVPRVLWALYPPDGDYTDAAVVHDELYWSQRHAGKAIERAQADLVFLEAMTALGIPFLRRHIIYRAVRLGGWVAWGNNQKLNSDLKNE